MSPVIAELFEQLGRLTERIEPAQCGPEVASMGRTGLILLDEMEAALTRLPREAVIIRGGRDLRAGFESLVYDFRISEGSTSSDGDRPS